MTNEDYALIQDRLIVMADFIRHMDLAAFINRIKLTEKAAPIFDKEIYDDLRDFQAILDIAEAANQFKTRLAIIRKRWRERKARAVLRGE